MLWQELHSWGAARRERLKNLIAQQCIVFPVDEQLCRIWARLRSDVQKAGRGLHVADAWIAATAIALGVPLATHNARDFSHVTGLQLISSPAG